MQMEKLPYKSLHMEQGGRAASMRGCLALQEEVKHICIDGSVPLTSGRAW